MADKQIKIGEITELVAKSIMDDGTNQPLSVADPGAKVSWTVDIQGIIAMPTGGFAVLAKGLKNGTVKITMTQSLSDGRSLIKQHTLEVTTSSVKIADGDFDFVNPNLPGSK